MKPKTFHKLKPMLRFFWHDFFNNKKNVQRSLLCIVAVVWLGEMNEHKMHQIQYNTQQITGRREEITA